MKTMMSINDDDTDDAAKRVDDRDESVGIESWMGGSWTGGAPTLIARGGVVVVRRVPAVCEQPGALCEFETFVGVPSRDKSILFVKKVVVERARMWLEPSEP